MLSSHGKIIIKTKKEIKLMSEGGKKLAEVKRKLAESVKVGVRALDIENLAVKLIKKTGGEPSFKLVPKYSWATCVNVNDGIVHGIPKAEIVFQKGDLVSVDVGLFYKGFHTDTSISVGLDLSFENNKFFKAGEKALKKAILKAKPGNYIYDISKSIESEIEGEGYTPVRALVGHGVGRELHEDPQIPCFTHGKRKDSLEIPVGAVFAIEVMYTKGLPDLALEADKWTISTYDGTISGLFEETVAITKNGPQVLT